MLSYEPRQVLPRLREKIQKTSHFRIWIEEVMHGLLRRKGRILYEDIFFYSLEINGDQNLCLFQLDRFFFSPSKIHSHTFYFILSSSFFFYFKDLK